MLACLQEIDLLYRSVAHNGEAKYDKLATAVVTKTADECKRFLEDERRRYEVTSKLSPAAPGNCDRGREGYDDLNRAARLVLICGALGEV